MRGQAQSWTSFRWSVRIVKSDQTLDQLTNTAKRLERDRKQRDRLIARASGEGASRREVAWAARLSVDAVQQILKRLGALMLMGGLALLMLTMPPAAHATPARDVRAERIVERIAAATIQGFRDDSLSIAELRAKMKRGEKIIASCGTDAHLASEGLRRAGIKARVVGAVTRLPFDGWNDGHIMVEARMGPHNRWTLYDPDYDRQPLSRQGKPMNIQQFANQGYSGRFRRLANDPPDAYDRPGALGPYADATADDIAYWRAHGKPKVFYNHVVKGGTPWVEYDGPDGVRFLHRRYDPRLPASYQRVSKRQWRRLMRG
jgi:Transglutaminase-like superfamily